VKNYWSHTVAPTFMANTELIPRSTVSRPRRAFQPPSVYYVVWNFASNIDVLPLKLYASLVPMYLRTTTGLKHSPVQEFIARKTG